MKLITKTLENRFEKIGRQELSNDPIIIAKFFNPCGSQSWFATEYEPETKLFFGYVDGTGFPEWGYFHLEEMESVRIGPFNMKIERDLHFREQKFSEIGL